MDKVLDFFVYPPIRSMLIYGTLSVSYATFNRVIMTKFFFDYPIVLLIMQMALLLFGIEALRVTSSIKLHAYTFQRGKDVFPASLLYIMAHFLNLNCLDGTTMPLFPFLQRFTPILIIELNRHFNRRARPSKFDLTCIGVICVSTAAASVYDWSFDLWSIIYGVVAVCMESYSLFLMEKLKDQYNSWLEILYMHSFNCLCVLLVADLIQDEIRDSFMYLVTSTTFLFVIILTIMLAIGVGFQIAMFYCLSLCGALHSSMMNIIANGIQLFVAYGLSIFLFYDLNPTWTNVFGVIIASCVAIYYYIIHRALDAGNTYMPTKYSIEKS